MYNGIGLLSAKGSGTNGYVQRNLANLPPQRIDFKDLNKSLKSGEAIKVKKANPELLLHEQKRKVEIELIKLEEELRTAGMSESKISESIESERKQMMQAVEDGTLRYDTELEKKDSHQLALDKERELARFEKALQINRGDHVSGQAFDQELQAQMKLERMQARAEQQQQRLIAAKKAEKAQKKAEKLRAKADKAKKKAQKKLEKLKAKQEKQRVKEELKAKGELKEKKEKKEKDKAKKKKKKDEGKDEEDGGDDSSSDSSSSDSDSSDSSDSSSDSSDSSDSSSSASEDEGKEKKKVKKEKKKQKKGDGAMKNGIKKELNEEDKENRGNVYAKVKLRGKPPREEDDEDRGGCGNRGGDRDHREEHHDRDPDDRGDRRRNDRDGASERYGYGASRGRHPEQEDMNGRSDRRDRRRDDRDEDQHLDRRERDGARDGDRRSYRDAEDRRRYSRGVADELDMHETDRRRFSRGAVDDAAEGLGRGAGRKPTRDEAIEDTKGKSSRKDKVQDGSKAAGRKRNATRGGGPEDEEGPRAAVDPYGGGQPYEQVKAGQVRERAMVDPYGGAVSGGGQNGGDADDAKKRKKLKLKGPDSAANQDGRMSAEVISTQQEAAGKKSKKKKGTAEEAEGQMAREKEVKKVSLKTAADVTARGSSAPPTDSKKGSSKPLKRKGSAMDEKAGSDRRQSTVALTEAAAVGESTKKRRKKASTTDDTGGANTKADEVASRGYLDHDNKSQQKSRSSKGAATGSSARLVDELEAPGGSRKKEPYGGTAAPAGKKAPRQSSKHDGDAGLPPRGSRGGGGDVSRGRADKRADEAGRAHRRRRSSSKSSSRSGGRARSGRSSSSSDSRGARARAAAAAAMGKRQRGELPSPP